MGQARSQCTSTGGNDRLNRILCYRFFSELFRGTLSSDLVEVWPCLAGILSVGTKNLDLGLAAQREWARECYGVGERTLWLTESSWRNTLGLQCQEPTRIVETFYAQSGMSPQKSEGMPADHLSLMLGFAGALLETQTEDERFERFISEHLGDWVMSLLKEALERFHEPNLVMLWTAFGIFINKEQERIAEQR